MKVVATKIEFAAARNALEGRLAVVPTMGALHDGHLALVHAARERANHVAATIFVNPTQFAPSEDFDSYPRGLQDDLDAFAQAGVDLVYTPGPAEVYPDGPKITVKAGKEAEGLESLQRPHFFDGVCTVVATLFDHIKPDIALFGEKDFQQLKVIQEMVAARSFPIEIVPVTTVRDSHGLALSSRNSYLSAEELRVARSLNGILKETADKIGAAPDRSDSLLSEGRQMLNKSGFDKIGYLDTRWNRLLAAVHLGSTRLIDNVSIS